MSQQEHPVGIKPVFLRFCQAQSAEPYLHTAAQRVWTSFPVCFCCFSCIVLDSQVQQKADPTDICLPKTNRNCPSSRAGGQTAGIYPDSAKDVLTQQSSWVQLSGANLKYTMDISCMRGGKGKSNGKKYCLVEGYDLLRFTYTQHCSNL